MSISLGVHSALAYSVPTAAAAALLLATTDRPRCRATDNASSDPDKSFVYFQGKGLTEAVVEKIRKTASKVVGRSYDFRLPDPAEEQRQAAMEAEQEAEEAEGEGESPPAPEAEKAQTTAAPEEAQHWGQRRKALEPRLLAALQAQTGEVAKMRAVFAYAQERAAAQEYAKALTGLDALEKLLAAAEAAADPAGAFTDRLKALMPRVTQAVAAGGPAGAEVKQRAAEAANAARPGPSGTRAGPARTSSTYSVGRAAR
jgi:hypothetical protein